MQKKLRRLRIDRQTVRTLTPESLEAAAGGMRTDDSCINSCNPAESTRIHTACTSAYIVISVCGDC